MSAVVFEVLDEGMDVLLDAGVIFNSLPDFFLVSLHIILINYP